MAPTGRGSRRRRRGLAVGRASWWVCRRRSPRCACASRTTAPACRPGPGADLRAVLLHQGRWEGDRAGPLHLAQHRARAPRQHRVASAPGAGTAFTITLPTRLAGGDGAGAAAPAEREATPGGAAGEWRRERTARPRGWGGMRRRALRRGRARHALPPHYPGAAAPATPTRTATCADAAGSILRSRRRRPAPAADRRGYRRLRLVSRLPRTVRDGRGGPRHRIRRHRP